jgi:DDE superfamily endonuclease
MAPLVHRTAGAARACAYTYAQLAAGFGVGTATAYRYITEAVEVLAALAPDLAEAMKIASAKAFVILDGTLLPIDRIAADRPFYSGKHKKHGMNVQVITDATGRLLWASPALPGAVHDIRAARTHGIIDALAQAGVECWADKGYRGAGGTIRLPYWGRWETLSAGQQAVNRSHAKIRALVEQAMATLKTWRLLRKLRCSTTRIARPRPSRPHTAPDLPKPRMKTAPCPTLSSSTAIGAPTLTGHGWSCGPHMSVNTGRGRTTSLPPS